MADEQSKDSAQSTQNTQYDNIGTKYNNIKVLPAAEPEEPSVVKALGDVQGKRCLGEFSLCFNAPRCSYLLCQPPGRSER
jgi:hypothetical protein